MVDATLFAASKRDILAAQVTQQIGSLLFTSAVLPFNMQAQTQSNWCWAATSTSVSHFYYLFSHWTQCLVANGELGHSDCCNSPVPGPCNVPWYLDRALQRTSNLDHMVASTISFSAIKAEIDAGRVIGARIGWSGGGGHFLVIRGYSQIGARQYVDVDDPIYGKSHLTLAAFSTQYQGNGSWTHSYFTKRWPPLRFNLPDLTAIAVDKIIETRPLLALKRGERSFAAEAPADRALSLPHHVYVAGLDAAASAEADPFQRLGATSLRVFESAGEQPRAVYDLTLDAAPEVATLSEDPAAVELLQKGAHAAAALVADGQAPPELRFLRIPALYVDAFWLHFPDAKRDVYIPVRGIGLFEPLQPVPAEKFIATTRKAAQERGRRPEQDAMAP
jgi:hypothetical protein